MAAKESLQDQKRRLALSLDASRESLTASGRALRRRLNPLRMAGRCFRRHPLRVFAATTAGAALLTWLLKGRSRRPKKSKSLALRLAGWALLVGKPLLRMWIAKRAKAYLLPSGGSPPTDSLLGP